MTRPLKNVLNQNGMGLAETLVATAMAAIVSIGILGFVQHTYRSQRNLKATQDFNDYVSLAQLSLDDVRACTYNFGSIDATVDGLILPDVGNDMTVEILHYDSTDPSKPRASAKKISKDSDGKELDYTLTKTIKLKTVAKTAPGHFIGRIIINAAKTGEIVGASQMTQGFPIYIITDDTNKIVSCYGNFASGGLADLQQKQCEVLLGPDYFWNPKTNKCETRYETKCVPGGQITASCDPVTTLGVASDVCTASGVIDPLVPVLPTRKYASGTVRAGTSPSAVSCEKLDKFSVRCDYADGVDSSGATCNACCTIERKEVLEASPGAT
jgi:type II secretory pathway pseudopilin PulG